MTGSPAAFRALALASTASVALGARPPRRSTHSRTHRGAPFNFRKNKSMSSPDTLKIPAELAPPRRSIRIRTLEGSRRTVERPRRRRHDVHGYVASPGDRAQQGRARSATVSVTLPSARRLRSAARQRRHHGFWDAATFHLIADQSQHLSFGEFSSKFASVREGSAAPQGPADHQE